MALTVIDSNAYAGIPADLDYVTVDTNDDKGVTIPATGAGTYYRLKSVNAWHWSRVDSATIGTDMVKVAADVPEIFEGGFAAYDVYIKAASSTIVEVVRVL
jgi:hypothetical protein